MLCVLPWFRRNVLLLLGIVPRHNFATTFDFMNPKTLLRSLTPAFLIKAWQDIKRQQHRKQLLKWESEGKILSQADLLADFRKMGIVEGDSLMIHSSMRSLGFLEKGPQTFIDAALEAVGKNGNLLMPSSPIAQLQLHYAQANPLFDIRETPSAMGAISEAFRKYKDVLRSPHPTEAVCAIGPNANWLTEGHYLQPTPYNPSSPFARLMQLEGKILYCGVTLDNAGTHLHTLEDTVDFPHPVYYEKSFNLRVRYLKGKEYIHKTRVHNPEWSRKRLCDGLIPYFEEKQVLTRHKLGRADCLLLMAKPMLDAMVEGFHSKGITMYAPVGK